MTTAKSGKNMRILRKLKKYLPQLGLVLLFLIVGVSWYFVANKKKKDEPQKTTATETKTEEKPAAIEVEKTEPPKETVIPMSALLSVPYTVQAPLVNWTVHEESCEEAAALMYHYYLKGIGFGGANIIPTATADKELRAMRSWQLAHWGKEWDLNMTEVGKLANQYFGYKYEVTEDITSENIKKAIAEGHPVLVPIMTHGLANPHYGPKTTYHILLIKGYDASGVVTNDAGVKEGRDYHYSWNVLWQAIDQQSAKMKQGRDMLVIFP